MTATAHALIGGAIASSVQNPSLGLPLAIISHTLADLVPHWDFGANWKKKSQLRLFIEASGDFLLGISLAYLFFGQRVDLLYLFAAVIAANIWDFFTIPYWFLKWRFPPISTVFYLQSKLQLNAPLPWGIITQIVVVGTLILLSQRIPQI